MSLPLSVILPMLIYSILKHDSSGAIFCLPFFLLSLAFFLSELRFALPIRWRLNACWDAFLCRAGSHRCVPICGSRCCWECIRCNPDSPAVKAHFERMERLGIRP